MTETSHTAHGGHDDHGHGHHHGSRFIQHHYDDAQHQFDSGKLGIWLFLAQEVLFFSALFVAYVLYRYHHPEVYGYAHKYLDVKYGAINTAVLIFSSLTAAWAVRAAQLGQKLLLIVCIVITIACAFTFLGIKYIEYSHKFHEHLLPGRYFDPCVSSNESPLLTRNNECPGSKSSVIWDYKQTDPKDLPLVEKEKSLGVPLTGCYAETALDTRWDLAGIQDRCTVSEVKIDLAKAESLKKAFEEAKKVDTKSFTPEQKKANEEKLKQLEAEAKATEFGERNALASKKITKRCPDPIETAKHHHEAAEGGEAPAHEEHGHGGEACWRIAKQPAVCRPNWYFHQWCSSGNCKDFGAYTTFGPFSKQSVCEDSRNIQAGKIEKAQKADKKLGVEKVVEAAIGDCVYQEAVGVIVEYGDHEERGEDIRILPTCDAPPQPPAEDASVDPLPDKPLPAPKVGEKPGSYHIPTTHEEHEIESAGPPPEHTSVFFTIYFAMTGLHGIHVLFGIFVFIWLLVRAIKGHFTPDYFGPVDFAALYWHIVDLIWIFLFPLLYLIH